MYVGGQALQLMPVISALWEVGAGGSPVTRSRQVWPTRQNSVSIKNIKLGVGWVPVIPAIWETEAGELLEPGRQRLQ